MHDNYSVRKLDIATWSSFMVVAFSAIIVAVCLPEISRSFSTDLSEGGGIETARSWVYVVIILITGMLAQRWGKKRFLLLGLYLTSLGLFLASFSQGYLTFVLALMITGAGGGFSEALLNPLITETHPRQSGKYLNTAHAFFPAGVMTASLLFGELLTLGVHWRSIFQIAAAAVLVVSVFFTTLRFPPEVSDDSSYIKQYSSILKAKGFWIFAIAISLGASIESAFTFWSRSYVDHYLSDVPRSGALAVVIFAAAMTIGRFLAGYLSNKTSLSNIMIVSGITGIAISILIPSANSLFSFYGLLALAGLATACFWPTIMAEADAYMGVNQTILFILLACFGIISFGAIPWVLGTIGDSLELRAGFAVIPLLFAALALVLLVERRMNFQKSQIPEQEGAAI